MVSLQIVGSKCVCSPFASLSITLTMTRGASPSAVGPATSSNSTTPFNPSSEDLGAADDPSVTRKLYETLRPSSLLQPLSPRPPLLGVRGKLTL
jgi:hypothetical protein